MRTRDSIQRQITKLQEKRTLLFNSANPNKWRMMDTLQAKIIDLWASWHRLAEKETHDKT